MPTPLNAVGFGPLLSEREKRMTSLLQRLSEWNTHMLRDHPINVLKGIIADADALLDELELPRVPDQPTEPASASSEGTSEPRKIPQPADR